MTPYDFFLVNAFTSETFGGNPAAICILSEPRNTDFMQKLAKEFNYSETAFLFNTNHNTYDLRWFTLTKEIDFCGHATLASAHALWQSGYCNSSQSIVFNTLSGDLTARKADQWIDIEFPAAPATELSNVPILIRNIIGIEPLYVGRNATDYLVVLPSENDVRLLNPDINLIAALPSQGFIVTSKSQSDEYDFVSRVFAPNDGIDEDLVCGAAHCCLGPYWGNILGKKQLKAYQASSRGGILRIELLGEKVYLAGQAVTIIQGNLLI